jgi:hypothetical protein
MHVPNESSGHLLQTILDFLESIGIPVMKEDIIEPTFLPGIKIHKGALIIDEALLAYPGDILHEAGHIAVMTPEERVNISGNVQEHRTEGENDELAAILWSYAALTHLNIAPDTVFHGEGYKGDSEWLIESFSNQQYIGLPLLQWMGLTTTERFPKMSKWIRD